MDRKIELIQYLPPFIKEYREIQNIMSVENPEFQLVVNESEKIKNNQFIVSCDLSGIEKYEKLLDITPSTEDTLDSRKSRVLIRWNDSSSYTWKIFLQKMNSLCGTNFKVFEDWKHYKLHIITHLNMYGQVQELNNVIEYMIPANIETNVKNELSVLLENDMRFVMCVVECKILELS